TRHNAWPSIDAEGKCSVGSYKSRSCRMKKESQISRRLFLRATTFAGAALASGLAPLSDLDGDTRVPFAPSARSQTAGSAPPSGGLNEWIERIFSREFAVRRFGPARWDEDGKSYTVLEPAHGN